MVHRFYVRRKEGFRENERVLAHSLYRYLKLKEVPLLALYERYDVQGLTDQQASYVASHLFSLPPRDDVTTSIEQKAWTWAVELLDGQFDQRSFFSELAIASLYPNTEVSVRCATCYSFESELSVDEKQSIYTYLVNELEVQQASFDLPHSLHRSPKEVKPVKSLEGFTTTEDKGELLSRYSLAMDEDDLALVQSYFVDKEREPTMTELRLIDTYWSDHCRHSTFLTELEHLTINDEEVQKTYDSYQQARRTLQRTKAVSLMDMATIAAKELRMQGLLDQQEISEEINACSVRVVADTDRGPVPSLLLFKNETHNHPTEVEPHGGAATCVGGAIRDPLSSRAYVYQAMRISGSGDPREAFSDTMEGKLPQRVIALKSALGNSSYGNQIGVPTGLVEEIYHPNFVAKHMELGFVVASTKEEHVIRLTPSPSDAVILVGGKTGRDGLGGATGSSKGHDETSLETSSAEVQKGNAPLERKIQRLLRKKEAAQLIKRCNDFGAGGVSVAIGELADGLRIDLDAVPLKYDGLDGTEIAISESQERMAMVVAKEDVETFIAYAYAEDLEATVVATVTDEPKLVMKYQGQTIVDLDRSFLDSNGAPKKTSVEIPMLPRAKGRFEVTDLASLQNLLGDLNMNTKESLARQFDATAGGGTLLLPYGGETLRTPSQVMAALMVLDKEHTHTATLSSWGYDPFIMEQNPFEGAFLAVTHSLAKVVASGGDWNNTFLSFQEYFGRVGKDPKKWGVVTSALLGAYKAQKLFQKGAIGGKDSMSGTFEEIDVPPTLVSFAIATAHKKDIISNEFKRSGSQLYLLEAKEEDLPSLFTYVASLIKERKVLSSWAIGFGGIAEALSKMSLGNAIGCSITSDIDVAHPRYGSFIVEAAAGAMIDGVKIGTTTADTQLHFPFGSISIDDTYHLLTSSLDEVYNQSVTKESTKSIETLSYKAPTKTRSRYPSVKPRVVLPLFYGTSGEYEAEEVWKQVGCEVHLVVIKSLNSTAFEQSIHKFKELLSSSEILFLSSGLSAADEPDGSGKYIAHVLRHPLLSGELESLLEKRDGLIGGIGDGFHALMNLGLFTSNKISLLEDTSPFLDYNAQKIHISDIVRTRVSSTLSPWMSNFEVGETLLLPFSSSGGRVQASLSTLEMFIKKGQIASQYVDHNNEAITDNIASSLYGIEALSSESGAVFGRMGHSDRITRELYLNSEVKQDIRLFEGATRYFS